MGNLLSCVSCNARQSKSKKTKQPDDNADVTPATASDHVRCDGNGDIGDVGSCDDTVRRTKAPPPQQQEQPTEAAADLEERRRQAATDYTHFDLFACLPDKSAVVDEADIEKVAGAIVHMTLFIASQVMCPAIQRYISERKTSHDDIDDSASTGDRQR